MTSDVTQIAQPGGPLLRVTDLRISSQLASGEHTITSGVNLELMPGEALAVVGESGSGKSMMARAIVGLLPPGVRAQGEVIYGDRDLLELRGRQLAAVRGGEIGLIFQDPFTMLNPLMRCGEHITELLTDGDGKRLSRRARAGEAIRRLAEVGIDDAAVADAYPFQLSGGMRQRIGIAAALARDPRILIADEPSTALDVTTQKEILSRIKELQESRGMGLILITHDLRVAFSMCDRVQVLYAGSVLERGDANAVEAEPRHPYTLGLLLTEPPGDRRLSELPVIGGAVPDPDTVAGQCAFAPRCAWALPPCREAAPLLVEAGSRHASACIRVGEIAQEMRALRQAADHAGAHVLAARSSEPLVEVRGIEKVFGGGSGERRVVALDGVSLEIGVDESVGLVGESGSGKTTLGRCLLGLEQPTGGTLTVGGIDASNYAALSNADRRRLRRTIQMVFQDPYSTLNPVRTVGATLNEALLVHEPRMRNVRQRTAELLERVGLPASYADRKPVALSGGERQRVAVARALAAEPRVIVCDEAVSALDVSVQAQVLNLLASVREELGVSYLFITHDLAVVRQIADRVYVLQRGSLVENGPCADVLDDPSHPYTRLLISSIPRSDHEWLAQGATPAAEGA
ncbi:MAG TPA: ABC transporter ATP-binding protein [Conexibacter sp.]|jgi:peptide/nickel transport system ATP-binding protein|nr:ABC transporter ATP-binding protein [Conexibacter sp.]